MTRAKDKAQSKLSTHAEIVDRAVRLYAEYMRQVAKDKGFRKINEYFDLDLLEHTIHHGTSKPSLANVALELLDNLDPSCDGGEGCSDTCPVYLAKFEVQERLEKQFHIGGWVVTYPLGHRRAATNV